MATPSQPNSGRGYDFDRLKDLPSCPPPDSVAREGTFYAFHDSDPPDQKSDFKTAAQNGSHQGKDECQRRSNSIWSDLAALQKRVEQLQRRHPLRYSFISAGEIKKESGVLDSGDGPHHSFWVCGMTSMHAIFKKRVV